MSSFNLRPRFKKLIASNSSSLESALKEALTAKDSVCTGYVGTGYCTIKIPISERHFWSPQLTISFEDIEDKTEIRGLYGPNPTVWAVFFFGYIVLGLTALFILVIGFSRITLDMSGTILWVIPGLGVAALVLYLIAQAGQKIGAEQMYTLHHFFEELLNEKVAIRVI